MAERLVTMEHTLRVLLEEKKYSTLKDVLITMNGADVAAVFEEIDPLAFPSCSVCCPKNWRRKPSWRWSRRCRSC